MNAQVNSLMLAYGILTIPAVLFFIALIVVAVIAQYTQGENQKRAQEKVIELTEKGHDAYRQSLRRETIHASMSVLTKNERQKLETCLTKVRRQALKQLLSEQT